jgi:hypothetical protein
MKTVAGRTMSGWRAGALELHLSVDDLDLVDAVLCVYPELRVVISLGQLARRLGLSYPVNSGQQLVDLLGNRSLILGGHAVDADSLIRALSDEWFPLAHEGEFLSAVHLGLIRCRTEAERSRLLSGDGATAGEEVSPDGNGDSMGHRTRRGMD